MSKIVASIDEIRAEMQRRIHVSLWANGYCRDCYAPSPYRISHDGIANWTAQLGTNAKIGCDGFVLDLVAKMRNEYALPRQTIGAVIGQLLSGVVRPD